MEKHEWPTTLLPPKVHVQIGRPPKKRKKSAGEVAGMVKGGKLSKTGLQVTCSICKQKGHNKRSCKSASARQSQSQHAASQSQSQHAASQSQSQPCASQFQGSASGVRPFSSQVSGSGAVRPFASGAVRPSFSANVQRAASQVQASASGVKRTKTTANRVLSPTKNV